MLEICKYWKFLNFNLACMQSLYIVAEILAKAVWLSVDPQLQAVIHTYTFGVLMYVRKYVCVCVCVCVAILPCMHSYSTYICMYCS